MMTSTSEIVFLILVTGLVLISPILSYQLGTPDTFQTYSTERRRYTWIVVSASIVGTIVGGGMFLAIGAVGFEAGVLGFIFGIVYLIGLVMFGALSPWMNKRLDELGAASLSEGILKFYGVSSLRLFAAVSLLIYIPLLSAQFIATIEVFRYLMPQFSSPWYIIIPTAVAAISALTYPGLGGLQRDIKTDTTQALVLMVCLGILFWSFVGTDPLAVMSKLSESRLNGLGYGYVTLIGLFVFLTPSFLVRTDMWQRALACETERGALTAYWVAGLVSLTFYVCFTYLGILGYVSGSTVASFASLDAITHLLGNGVAFAVVIGAFFAAVLSSADTFINNAGLHLYSMIRPSDVTNGSLLHVRVSSYAVLFVAALLALIVRDLVDLFVASLSLLLIFLPGLLGMMFGSSASARSFNWSVTSSLILFGVLFAVGDPKSAFAPAVLLSIAVYFSVRLLVDRRTASLSQ